MKITSHNFKIDIVTGVLVLVMLFFASSNLFSQITITSVSPTRITTGSKVTITGTGFTSNLPVDTAAPGNTTSYIRVGAIDIVPGSRTFVSPEVMTFVVAENPADITGVLSVAPGVSAPEPISYVAPNDKPLERDKPYFVKEIYTNWKRDSNNFWRSNEWSRNGTENNDPDSPNDNHELLGYMMSDGTIYSTGVDDEDLLEPKLLELGVLTQRQIDGVDPGYQKEIFKAYSTNGVQGKTVGGAVGTYIIAADAIDGLYGNAESAEDNISDFPKIDGLKVFDAIIDGKHGLNLGIGITNFNTKTEIQFFSGNGQPGVLGDSTPDLLITQIADAKDYDIYFYADEDGDIVGRPIKFSIKEKEYRVAHDTRLSVWQMDLYQFTPGLDFNIAVPTSRIYAGSPNNLFKPLRMAAFDLEDFEIFSEEDIKKINNINMNAGGSADMAFLAYNQGTFNLKSPTAESLLSKFVCRVVEEGGNTTITFELIETGSEINVGIDDDDGGIREPNVPSETLTFQWLKYNTEMEFANSPSLTIPGVNLSDLATYKVKIGNEQGTIVLPVDLIQGGTPYYWENGVWSNPYDELDPVDSMERGLVFNESYDGSDISSGVLEGCDCIVKPGADVIIPGEKTLKLYNTITVDGELEIYDDSLPPVLIKTIPAGTFTLENNASLVQIKPLPLEVNENRGDIIVKRDAKDLVKYDYVYWSSPIENGNVDMIPGATQHIYWWDVNLFASNQTGDTQGNWSTVGIGPMQNGKGYIKRVNNGDIIHAAFEGVPNNGDYNIQLQTTSVGASNVAENRHWNLVGNPYPSAINPDKLLTDNMDVLAGVLQVWTHETPISSAYDDPFYQDFKLNYKDDYLTYNLTAPTDPRFEGYIASGQGFVVQAREDANDKYLKFTNAMRFDPTTENTYNNTQFYRGAGGSDTSTNQNNEKQLIWLALTNESKVATVAVVGYVDGATNGKDRLYDAKSGSGDMRIYSVLEDSDFLIQGRALPFDDNDKVPLGIEILKNGIYKIGIDHLKGSLMLNEDQGIYLEDTYNNVIHDLRTAPYGFTASAGDIKDRFVLRYTNKTLSVDDKQMSDTFVYIKNQQLYVKASKNIESVMVYDLSGKKLMDYKLDGYSDAFNTQFQFSRGAYLTVIKLENSGTITRKVMN